MVMTTAVSPSTYLLWMSMTTTLWQSFAAICIFASVWLSYRKSTSAIRRNGKRLRRPPNTLPFLGNSIQFLKPRNELFEWFTNCANIYDTETLEISVPSLPPGVVINNPDILEFVLRRIDLFSKGEFFRERSFDLFGHGIINVDGPAWKAQRKAASTFFSTATLKTLVDIYLPRAWQNVTADLETHCKSQQAVDLELICTNLTTQIMGDVAYDTTIESSSPFFQSFEYASSATGERFQSPLWRITERFTKPRLATALREVKEFGKSIVNAALRKHAEAEISDKPQSLIELLIDEIKEPSLVADAALNFLSAGRDTTAQALTWTLYRLSRNPEILSQLQQSLDLDSSHNGNPDLLLTPYLHATINESLRLHPPVPFELKQAQHPTALPDGTFLPAGAIVVWCPYAIGRAERIWGPDALEFKPGRWLEKTADGNIRMRARRIGEFPVFNGGPRACLGKRMAEVMMAWVLRRFVIEWEWDEIREKGGSERISRNSLTLPMEGGLPCLLRKRARV